MPIRMLCPSALVLVLAGCAHDAATQGPPAQDPQKSARASATRVPHPGIDHARRCEAGDLVVHLRPEGDGAGGHAISLLDFRNVSTSRCLLSGYPRRVMLSEPGHRDVRATEGSFFPVEGSAPIDPGEVTSLGVETDASCDARPTGGPGGPMYHEVRISLPGGVMRVTVPRGGLDVGCGAHLTTFTTWQ